MEIDDIHGNLQAVIDILDGIRQELIAVKEHAEVMGALDVVTLRRVTGDGAFAIGELRALSGVDPAIWVDVHPGERR